MEAFLDCAVGFDSNCSVAVCSGAVWNASKGCTCLDTFDDFETCRGGVVTAANFEDTEAGVRDNSGMDLATDLSCCGCADCEDGGGCGDGEDCEVGGSCEDDGEDCKNGGA